MARKFPNIFVEPDDPAYLEKHVDPVAETFDLEKSDARSLLDSYRARQRAFSTAPFDPAGERLRFFPGGFTIWSGFPGAGKTTLLRQLACHLMRPTDEAHPFAGPGVFVCSLEESPHEVLIRHAMVACATEELSDNSLQWCMDLWTPKLRVWNYRPIEADARHATILAAIRVLARDYGVRHVVLDSLMCLDVPSNDYEAQRLFAGALARTVQASGTHVHLVAHPRKPNQSNQEPDISDVAGSADLGRKADNVVFVKRAAQELGAMSGDCTPMVVSIRKQRYGTGFIGDIGGWFNRRFRQFVLTQWQQEPTRYLTDAAYADMWDRRA